MKIRSAIMISGALALMLVSGCQSSPEPESAPTPAAGQSGTVEASEPEYSADLELTVTFPDKTVYTSTDNGVTWTAGEKTVSYNDMAAFLTVIYPEPISVTGEIPVAMTIHNNNHNTDMRLRDRSAAPRRLRRMDARRVRRQDDRIRVYGSG